MENQSNAHLLWPYFAHGKTTEELKQSLMYTTMELEQTKILAHEEIRKREEQLIHLKNILTKTIKERDEAIQKCSHLKLNNLLLQQQQNQNYTNPPLSGASSIENEPQKPQNLKSNKSLSSSDCEESIVSPERENSDKFLPEKPLPEKGKLLQAVIKAGPLLQTLLLAGPLPQWRHPPPPLKTFEIPPVTIPPPPPQFQSSIVNNECGKFNRKRVSETKYQKVLLH